MSKGGQIAARARAGFHSIPAVPKPQMERRIKERVLQLCLLTSIQISPWWSKRCGPVRRRIWKCDLSMSVLQPVHRGTQLLS
jgi:hypothetical protein